MSDCTVHGVVWLSGGEPPPECPDMTWQLSNRKDWNTGSHWTHWHPRSLFWTGDAQVASLQQEHPALVACYFMSYLQEDASLEGNAAPQPPAQPSGQRSEQTPAAPGAEGVRASALPSTRAGARVVRGGGPMTTRAWCRCRASCSCTGSRPASPTGASVGPTLPRLAPSEAVLGNNMGGQPFPMLATDACGVCSCQTRMCKALMSCRMCR